MIENVTEKINGELEVLFNWLENSENLLMELMEEFEHPITGSNVNLSLFD